VLLSQEKVLPGRALRLWMPMSILPSGSWQSRQFLVTRRCFAADFSPNKKFFHAPPLDSWRSNLFRGSIVRGYEYFRKRMSEARVM